MQTRFEFPEPPLEPTDNAALSATVTCLDAGVWWRPFDDDLLGQPGTFTVTGVIENNLVEAEATVVVDTCPDGYSAEQSVTFSDLDSGVPNRDRGNGCTFLDLVWSQAPFADHGAFVAAVEIVKDEYEAAGLITGREGGTIMVTAAQAIDAWREGPPDPRRPGPAAGAECLLRPSAPASAVRRRTRRLERAGPVATRRR